VTLCIVDSAAIYIMVVKFRNTICPLHRSSPFIGGLRCLAIQTEQGPYIEERTQKAVVTAEIKTIYFNIQYWRIFRIHHYGFLLYTGLLHYSRHGGIGALSLKMTYL
jgi:hypothetical protein